MKRVSLSGKLRDCEASREEASVSTEQVASAHTQIASPDRLLAPAVVQERYLNDHAPLLEGSPQMRAVRTVIENIADTDATVLIRGESGVGKDLVARAIHAASPRCDGPFVKVNCAAIPLELLESELFGHEKGAFTGAHRRKPGQFEYANKGTIYLDEIAELPLALQAKLLHVLQDFRFSRVGGQGSIDLDTRVIAATNRDLEHAMARGEFREDLYYRLNVVRINMPPLRERMADVPALVTAFLRRFNQRFNREIRGIAPDAMARLLAYDFPGNVRELENLIERAYALGARDEITLADLPALGARRDPAPPSPPSAPAAAALPPVGVPTLAQAERDLILRALEIHHNDRALAARALGLSPRTLYRRLKEYGVV